MGDIIVEFDSVLSCNEAETRDWYASNDLRPPKPDNFNITGEVKVPHAGVTAMITPRVPSGINPTIFQFDLTITQHAGHWDNSQRWLQVRFEKVIMGGKYTSAEIFCGDKILQTIDVEDLH